MTTTIAADGTKARILFAGLYLMTLAILLVIFTTLWEEAPVQPAAKNAAAATPANDGGAVLTISLLQSRMQGLQDDYLAASATKDKGKMTAAENLFTAALDSAEKSLGTLNNEDQKTALKNVTAGFRTSFRKTSAIVQSYASAPKDTVYANKENDEVVQNLKAMLVDKEQKIAELQTGMQQQLSAKDQTIATLETQVKSNLAGKDKNISALQTQMQTALADKDKKYVALQTQTQTSLSEKDKRLAALQNQLQTTQSQWQATVADKDKKLAGLQAQMQTALAERDKRILLLQSSAQNSGGEKDKKWTALQASLQSSLTEKDRRIAALQSSLQTATAEKDRTVAGLQNQIKALSSRPNVAAPPQKTVTDGSAEWRQKYAQLKSSYDNLSSKNNSLLNSYKTLALDNKRLATQLQIRRATARG